MAKKKKSRTLFPSAPILGPRAEFLCQGSGQGPKNVLAKRIDGRKIVVPQAVWRSHQ